jgi:serine/threonine protein phosphatase PrpC
MLLLQCTGVKDGDAKWRCQDSVVCIEAHTTIATTVTAATTAAAAAAGASDTSSVRSVFAVFDGHGSRGREASALCATRLEKALTARILQTTTSNSNPACSLSSVAMSFGASSAALSINGTSTTNAAASAGSLYSSITNSSSNISDKVGPVGHALAHVCWQLQKELQTTAKLDCANVSVHCHVGNSVIVTSTYSTSIDTMC